MKKILPILLLITAFTACQVTQKESTQWTVKTITVRATEWILSGRPNELNSYYYVDKSISELTSFVFNEGVVIGYIRIDNDIKNPLPYVLHKGEADAYGEYLWTQTFDFDFSPGNVRFYVTFSNFMTGELHPETETFDIVLMW
ncbi:MAG: hypothetical protein LBD91_03820 [Prevotellaceae bacterium]|jgi:hypothetical protein|nr:hypothetical protein [Prevotellaceae bacterium]